MTGPLEVLVFVLLSSVAVAASLHAWRTRQAYGFFRFLGFELLAGLCAWNAGRWFRDPISFRQIVSWTVFVASAALAAHGFHLLRSVGRGQRRMMEDARTVVEVGAYRYIRHPLHSSLVFFGWGVFLKGFDLASGALALAATAFWIVTARCEERFSIDHFGEAYSSYMRRTKMFVPFLL